MKMAIVRSLSKSYFEILLPVYLLLVFFELFTPGSVTNFFNLNSLLLITIVCGILMIATNYEASNTQVRAKIRNPFKSKSGDM